MPSTEAWAYVRVSSEQQADKALPVQGQRQAIERYCVEHGLALTRVFVDEAVSGSTDQRQQFQAMVALAQKEKPQAIVMWSWSRFSRDQNDALFYKALLRRCGVQVVTVEEDLPRVDGLENVLESMIHWRDEQHLKTLSHDVKRGHRALVEAGGLPTVFGNQAPRGYRLEQVEADVAGKRKLVWRLVEDEETASLVRQAFQMRLAGASFREINRATGLYRDDLQLGRMFQRTAYKGELAWGDLTLPVPALVSTEEWTRVQATLGWGRGGGEPRRRGSTYLLSGLLRCKCGWGMVGHQVRRTYRYYRCSRIAHGGDCPLVLVPVGPCDSAVLAFVFQTILSEEAVAEALEYLAGEGPELLLESLYQRQRALEGRVEALLRAIELSPRNAVLVGRLDARMAEQREVEAGIQRALERAEPQVVDVAQQRRALMESLASGNPSGVRQARELLRQRIAEIVVQDKTTALVRYWLPVCATVGSPVAAPTVAQIRLR